MPYYKKKQMIFFEDGKLVNPILVPDDYGGYMIVTPKRREMYNY